jgi:SnoaL-like domain
VSDALQRLLDRAAISDVVHAYATGLDRRDWALYRSIFSDHLEMDFASVGIRAGSYTADAWVRSAQTLFAGFVATQHTSGNHVHEIHGDAATCVSNMQAEHFIASVPGEEPLAPGAERWTIGGYYVNELVRAPSGWKLWRVTLNVTWTQGNPEVPRIALRRGRALRAEKRA